MAAFARRAGTVALDAAMPAELDPLDVYAPAKPKRQAQSPPPSPRQGLGSVKQGQELQPLSPVGGAPTAAAAAQRQPGISQGALAAAMQAGPGDRPVGDASMAPNVPAAPCRHRELTARPDSSRPQCAQLGEGLIWDLSLRGDAPLAFCFFAIQGVGLAAPRRHRELPARPDAPPPQLRPCIACPRPLASGRATSEEMAVQGRSPQSLSGSTGSLLAHCQRPFHCCCKKRATCTLMAG